MMPVLRGLQAIRERQFLSRQALAARAGVSEKTIFNLERGRPARWTTARKLTDALGCRPQALLDAPPASGTASPSRRSATTGEGATPASATDPAGQATHYAR